MTEKNSENKELSRRNFLKVAGGTAAGVALGGVVFSTIGSETSVSAADASEGYIVVDSKHCAGCYSCMMACSMAHEGKISLTLSRIQILQDAYNEWPADIKIAQCRQCVDPLCVRNCPTHACHVDTDNGNVRVIDESKCIGCQMCIQSCPFIPHRTIWNPEKSVSMKCDLCANTPYWEEEGGIGGKQACVEICPEEALKLVTDIPSQIDESDYEFDLTAGTEAADTTATGGH